MKHKSYMIKLSFVWSVIGIQNNYWGMDWSKINVRRIFWLEAIVIPFWEVYVMLCTILYHLYNLKNMKTPIGEG